MSEDNAVIGLLTNQSRDLSQIKTDLAINTTKTGAIEEHLKTLNGKVATQEVRQQEQAATQALLAQAITSLKDTMQTMETRTEKNDNIWRENRGKVIWGLIVIGLMLFYYILTHIGFPNFLSH
jgi:hypothetical protein